MRNQWLLLIGSLIYFFAIVYAAWGGATQPLSVDLYLIGLWVAFCGYFASCVAVFRAHDSDQQISVRVGQFVLFLAIATRLVMLSAPARFNSDVSRYVWDGQLVCQGINPYEFVPADPELDHVRDAQLYANLKTEFNEVRTVYGPVSMLAFAASQQLDWLHQNDHLRIRIMMVLGDIVTIFLLALTLSRLGQSQLYVLVYALNPLLIDSFAQRGQMEGILLPWIALGILLFACRRWASCGVVLAIAASVKINLLLPGVVVFAALISKDRKSGCAFALFYLVVFTLLHIPLIVVGQDAASGLVDYATVWKTNGSVFSLFDYLLEDVMARRVTGVVFLALSIFLTYRASASPSKVYGFCKFSAWWFVILLMLSPSVFPWYVTWTLPLVTICGTQQSNRNLFWLIGMWAMMSLGWYLNFVNYDPKIVPYFSGVQDVLSFLSQYITEPWRIPEYFLVYWFLALHVLTCFRHRDLC